MVRLGGHGQRFLRKREAGGFDHGQHQGVQAVARVGEGPGHRARLAGADLGARSGRWRRSGTGGEKQSLGLGQVGQLLDQLDEVGEAELRPARAASACPRGRWACPCRCGGSGRWRRSSRARSRCRRTGRGSGRRTGCVVCRVNFSRAVMSSVILLSSNLKSSGGSGTSPHSTCSRTRLPAGHQLGGVGAGVGGQEGALGEHPPPLGGVQRAAGAGPWRPGPRCRRGRWRRRRPGRRRGGAPDRRSAPCGR